MDMLELNGAGQERIKVTAEDLYQCLSIQESYDTWIETMGEDAVTIIEAKQICLAQKTERGNMYFQYFNMIDQIWSEVHQLYAEKFSEMEQTSEALKKENQRLIRENKRMKAKVIFADAVAASSDSILIGDLAKILKQNQIDVGQKRLFDDLREEGYLIKSGQSKNMPTQKSMKLGLFEIKETAILNPEGKIQVKQTAKITGKGQQYFINKYLKKDL